MNELKIELLRKLCKEDNIKWTMHALKRMRDRKINSDEVIECIISGEIIEQYPDDRPLPSCLINGKAVFKAMHTVVSSDTNEIYVITAYEPNPAEWDDSFSRRKESE